MNGVDAITHQIIGAAMRVHSKFGAGLLESVYTPCLAQELLKLGLQVEVGLPVAMDHEGLHIPRAYVLDLLVENCVIVEIKSVKSIEEIHAAQLLTYLRLKNLQVGLVINFNVTSLKYGIRRVANHYQDPEVVSPESR